MKRTVKKPTERKEEIVLAARSLFQTKKHEKVTIQDVMESLGIAKGTVYHYFKSKEELLEAVVENIVNANIDHMKRLMQETTGTALEKIKFLAKAGDISTQNAHILEDLHQPSNSAMHTRVLASMLTKQAVLYEQLIKQGCKEGIFNVDNPLECAEIMLAGIQFLTDKGIYPWPPEDLQRRTAAFPKILERLLQAPSGSFDFMLEITQK